MSGHTPGPWGTRPHSHYLQVVTDRGLSEDSIAICDLFHRRTTDPLPVAEHEANARLIAAAPEMLEALNEAVTNGEWSEGEQCGDWCIGKEVYETLRDAIAKAESNT